MNFSLKQTDCFSIVGQRQSGKSTLSKWLVSQLLAAGISVTIVDPMGEYSEFESQATIYVPSSQSPVEVDQMVSKRIWREGNQFVIYDEAEMWFPNKQTLSPYAFRLFLQGAHRNVGIGLTTKRTALLNTSAAAQSLHWFVFPVFLPQDVRFLQQFVAPETFAAMDKAQKRYSFVYFNSVSKQSVVCPPVPI